MSNHSEPATPLNPDPKDTPLPTAAAVADDDRVPATGLGDGRPQPPPPSAPPINPWLFVPVLYFMQAVPNIMVTETFGTAYKNLGVKDATIALWTGLAALPWAFKMFWGPLVDLNFTKRQWTVAMEVLITGSLLVATGAFLTQGYFPLTVAMMFLLATFSATHDIACDGLYLMSLDKKRQAAFSGVMATFSRFGRLFCASLLVAFAGWVISGGLTSQRGWAMAMGLGALVYGGGMLWNLLMLPRPGADVPAADVAPGERTRNVIRTITVILFGVALYYFIDGALQFVGYGIFKNVSAGAVPANWDMPGTEMRSTAIRLAVAGLLTPVMWIIIRRQLSGTAMGEAFATYFGQQGFPAILAFIIFYRFGEAMVFAMAKLFILGSPEEGGMGVSLQQFGAIQGVGQVAGLIIGGLVGGWFISRVGLRKAFWPLVVGMHTPNLLYVWAAYMRPDPIWLYPVVFFEAMGYGFGFAGYFVYLMHVAQRGKFVTSHYAIGTGLGALFITFAFITAGIIRSVYGYTGVFIAACLFTIPGTLTLLFIPIDEEETKKLKAAGNH